MYAINISTMCSPLPLTIDKFREITVYLSYLGESKSCSCLLSILTLITKTIFSCLSTLFTFHFVSGFLFWFWQHGKLKSLRDPRRE